MPNGKISTLVVIAPNGVHRNWLQEITLHMPELYRASKDPLFVGDGKEKKS